MNPNVQKYDCASCTNENCNYPLCNTNHPDCNCSSCRGTQYRDFNQTWTYPQGSIVPSNWNYLTTVGHNITGPNVERPMRYGLKEEYCYSCSPTPFSTSGKTWTYQKPYSA